AAYFALYLALFTGLLRWMSTGVTTIFLWGAPALWVVLELARTYLFSGFPWALLGYSQYDQLPVIQIADITGVYGVSFLVVLTNILLAHVLQIGLAQVSLMEIREPMPGVRTVLALAVLVGSLLYGHWRLAPHPTLFTDQTLRIGMVHPNVAQYRKRELAFAPERITALNHLGN